MASDLGLDCLPMSHKKNARLIWVKTKMEIDEYLMKQDQLRRQNLKRLKAISVNGSHGNDGLVNSVLSQVQQHTFSEFFVMLSLLFTVNCLRNDT